jgi:Xaa-Pro aminopeptidase
VADAALRSLLPAIRTGVTEAQLALDLEWAMRSGGAEALAFDVAALAGPRAALPHGAPGARPATPGSVLLFDFGAQVCGYRSDMTRTLFVGEPAARDLAIHALVAEAQEAAFDALAEAVAAGEHPTNRRIDAAARERIDAAGHGEHFGHGLGHGIGLATHELPSLGRLAAEEPLPSPTVFSVEPGIYLDDETGVRIEDLVVFDPRAGRLERLTGFPREVTVVG